MLTNKQTAHIRKKFNGTAERTIFKALGDANRYHIFTMLSERGRLTVTDIAQVLAISVSLASQHLKIMEQAHILEKSKRGQKVYYQLQSNNPITKSILTKVL